MSEPRPHTGPVILGSVLGSYRIERELSTGGMGTVFRAEHVLLGRPAAVKVLRPELTTDDELVQRFVTEARAVTACKHPGIVEVYDFGYTEDGRAFIVMELLEGESLGQRLSRTRLAEPEAAAIAHGIASALKAAHKVGVIHRDLKPDNVFLVPDPDGGPDRTKVLDFGIAKLADPSPAAARHTQTGTLMGTPLYMAPEQAREPSTIDPRADLYSLGCILYQMLVGRPPFVAEGAGEIIALQLLAPVEPPSRLAQVTPEMEWLVLRLLEKEPADRFDNAAALATALAAFDTLLANRTAWPRARAAHPGAGKLARPSELSEFDDLAPTLPPELGNEAPPGFVPGRHSAIPIVAEVLTVLALAAGGLTYAMLRRGGDAPAPGGPGSGSASVASPAAPPLTAATPVVLAAPTATPARPGGRTAGEPSVVGSPGRHVPRSTLAGHDATNPTGPTDAPDRGPGTRPGTDPALPDRESEVIREIRQVDPPRPGEHTPDGSPMESTLDPGTPTPKPTVADPPGNVLPSAAPPKDPSPP